MRNPFRFRLPRKYFAVGCHFHGTGRRKPGANYPRCGADCHSGVYHHHAAGTQPARAAGTGDFAAPGFNAGYGLRHHHHHQISADADWRAGRLLDDWY